MKSALAAAAATGLGLALAVADHTGKEPANTAARFPADCAIDVNMVHKLLPRAGLRVENRTPRPVRVAVAARGALARTELGTVGARETRIFSHVLPAGRNVLVGSDDTQPARRFRGVVYVNNHGPATCEHRYLWQIE
jgi:hypothetical protein